MFLLSFIPDALIAAVVNGVLIAGAVLFAASFFFGFIVRYVPALIPYRLLIQIISIPLLIAGVYFKSGLSVEMEWRDKVAALEKKVQESEQKAKEANEKIRTVYVDKIKVVKDTQVVVQEKIVKEKELIDAECKVAPVSLEILNNSARNKK